MAPVQDRAERVGPGARERREFYRLRRRENDEADFTYSRITYTVSESDLTPPDSGDAG